MVVEEEDVSVLLDVLPYELGHVGLVGEDVSRHVRREGQAHYG